MAEVAIRREGPVLWITLDRPEARNALNAPMHAGLAVALEEAAAPWVRAVVLTGAGAAFSAGQDVRELLGATHTTVVEALRAHLNRSVLAIRALQKPVIAAVNGPAAGAGLALALACDVRIASDSAAFVPGFGGLGLAPDTGATWLAARLLGAGRAFEWLTTGRRLSAQDALQWGLVSEVVRDDELPERAAEVSELFAAMPTRSVWETKRLLDQAQSATLEQQLETETLAQGELARTDDFTEGVAAFLDKREPAFTGAAAERIHPVQLVVTDDLSRWRLTVLFRLALAVPHAVVASAWLFLAAIATVVSWVLALVLGRVPEPLHQWVARALRLYTHYSAYTWLIADPFPGFRGWYGTYPVDLDVAPAEHQPRWSTGFRIVLAVPAYVLAYVLATVLQVVAIVGWFAALILGRMPRGMRDLMAYCLRYQAQTYAYLLLLTSRYPSLASGSGYQFEEAHDVRSGRP